MHLDVHDIRDFYYRSTLGRAAQGVIRGELQRLWREAKGQNVAGFGFAVPLLRPFLGEMHAALHAKGSKAPRTAFGLRSAPKPCLGSKCPCRAHSPDH